jgi:diguanylate cyclase (GGDEF)-like protein/PAS domain S-box-containing protein
MERSGLYGDAGARLGVALARNAWQVALLVDRHLIVRGCNEAARALLGYEPEELIGRVVGDLLPNQDVEAALYRLVLAAEDRRGGFRADRHLGTHLVRVVNRAGSEVAMAVSGTSLLDDDDAGGLLVTLVPQLERYLEDEVLGLLAGGHAMAELERAVVALATIQCHGLGGFHVRSLEDNPLISACSAFLDVEELTGLVPAVRSALRAGNRCVRADDPRVSLTARRVLGRLAVASVWCIPVRAVGDDAVVVLRPQANDPTRHQLDALEGTARLLAVAVEREGNERRLRWAASHDHLTGLANRAEFDRRLSMVRPADEAVILLIDLDGFKAVNDTYGHQAGDLVLIGVADRLTNAVRVTDVVSRLGGDEFAVLLAGADLEAARIVIERIQERIAEPVRTPEGLSLHVGCSIGLARTDGVTEARDLLAQADAAMYEVKRRGGGARRSAGHPVDG